MVLLIYNRGRKGNRKDQQTREGGEIQLLSLDDEDNCRGVLAARERGKGTPSLNSNFPVVLKRQP